MMSALRVRLFGAFEASLNNQPIPRLNGKAQELFCYLLLHRDQPNPREKLAGLLWERAPAARSRKYLRDTLWQLHTALHCGQKLASKRLLGIAGDDVRAPSGLWLDVAEFEQAFTAPARGPLGEAAVRRIQQAVALYRGDLLEGYSQRWCVEERERLQCMYLVMLEQLMTCCEARGEYEAGLCYGAAALRCDAADERAHRRMMWLHWLAGDRAGALRQYAWCAKALKDELEASPSAETNRLYDQIRAGSPVAARSGSAAVPLAPTHTLADRVHELRTMLGKLENELRQRDRARTPTSSRKSSFLGKRLTPEATSV